MRSGRSLGCEQQTARSICTSALRGRPSIATFVPREAEHPRRDAIQVELSITRLGLRTNR
jgi:hypothetical protein